jgi:hypothetical protein
MNGDTMDHKFTQSDCVSALKNIQSTLDLMASAAATRWNPDARRWLSSARKGDNIYDFAGTLKDCFDENNFGAVLRWIEFNIESGPVRRERLSEILNNMGNEIDHIENGNDSDPFRWIRESIHDAAKQVPIELIRTAEYVGELLDLIEKPASLPLSEREQEVYNYLCNNSPATGKHICNELAIEQSTLTRHIIPELKRKRGVSNEPGAGYYVPRGNAL